MTTTQIACIRAGKRAVVDSERSSGSNALLPVGSSSGTKSSGFKARSFRQLEGQHSCSSAAISISFACLWLRARQSMLAVSFQESAGKVRQRRSAGDSLHRRQPLLQNALQPAALSLSSDAPAFAKTRNSSQLLCGKFFGLSGRSHRLFYRANPMMDHLLGLR